jgi:hypothetical protein
MTTSVDGNALSVPIRFFTRVGLNVAEVKDLQEIGRVRLSCHFSPMVATG